MSLHIQLTSLGLAGQPPLLRNISLHIAPGTIHSLMGPSGCGKSSLLMAVAGQLQAPMSAQCTVKLADQDLSNTPAHLRRIGMLFQDDLLFPHMSVFDNLLFAVACERAPRAEQQRIRRDAVLQALAHIEMSDKAKAWPQQLSGGERTRVALMRALLAKPHALLLDEPFAKLDLALRERLRTWVYKTLRDAGVPTLVVSHDQQDVANTQALSRLSPVGEHSTGPYSC